ncbi:MAG: FtsQ-type POTRA domain-containing protein [Alphaproteobacteria bacterium]|nr:FtsQ-type POTRA domain-containing protein [Alphaproteobacteria bacterium]
MHKRALFKKIRLYSLLASGIIILLSIFYYGITCDQTSSSMNMDFVKKYSASVGFYVKKITIYGTKIIDEEDVLNTLSIKVGDPLFAPELDFVRLKIMKMPWVKNASLHRKLTGEMEILIEEYEPFCLWRKNKTWKLVAEDEAILDENPQLAQYVGLPRVEGTSAPQRLRSLYQILKDVPVIRDMLQMGELVGQRRWNLFLHNNIIILLPEEHVERALRRLMKLLAQRANLFESVERIDLRVPERIILQNKDSKGGKKNH